ncbi:VOC family protein [Propioniciclava sp.]|uniref:VOC family protein n=1 Tax=Propioniciclava sp. TaxID=2038686 RepID=UPI002618AB41|nr:VOC family protein [Propioniciclava sp.]
MSRPIHFEIQADDLERAKAFYGGVFGWTFEDYSPVVNAPYFGVVTGDSEEPGINGGLLPRPAAAPAPEQGVNGAVLTMGVDDYDAVEAKILEAGGTVALPKMALTGMAWQGYYLDTEGNTFGIHQPDENAQ